MARFPSAPWDETLVFNTPRPVQPRQSDDGRPSGDGDAGQGTGHSSAARGQSADWRAEAVRMEAELRQMLRASLDREAELLRELISLRAHFARLCPFCRSDQRGRPLLFQQR